jgi:hypothetical protein
MIWFEEDEQEEDLGVLKTRILSVAGAKQISFLKDVVFV